MKSHGESGWQDYPSYLDTFLPLIISFLDELNLKITFFIVGKDASLKKNSDALRLISSNGHEVGNHSFHHDIWIHQYNNDRIAEEINSTANSIEKATGLHPVGFRGPGFVYSRNLLEVVSNNGTLFDATLLPTYIGPLARMYFFWKSDLTSEERKKRQKIYSRVGEALRPVKPFYWKLASGKNLLEIPVTTIPLLKIPFHLSYLIYLSSYSTTLMRAYLKIAVSMCKLTNTQPSFLLHPLDFIGLEDVPELAFFPGMKVASSKKRELARLALNTLKRNFKILTMGEHAIAVEGSSKKREIEI
jgi:peptidoglycan/xylan/chitin deacetylase (PgdA/CDA1 family)